MALALILTCRGAPDGLFVYIFFSLELPRNPQAGAQLAPAAAVLFSFHLYIRLARALEAALHKADEMDQGNNHRALVPPVRP